MDNRSKILILVEGDRTDVRLMEHLLDIYGIGENHQIVPYHTNIYTLYNEMFRDGDPESLDLLQVLKAHEKNPDLKKLFDLYYSDILLVFDLDPQDPQFSPDKIEEMASYFVESSEMGKLYLNYPMVEAFYHMKDIPDEDYNSYTATMEELRSRSYKQRVNRENRNHDQRKFAINRDECSTVIRQNIEKAQLIAKQIPAPDSMPNLMQVLRCQLEKLSEENQIAVLCTCAFYIVDFNPNLIKN